MSVCLYVRMYVCVSVYLSIHVQDNGLILVGGPLDIFHPLYPLAPPLLYLEILIFSTLPVYMVEGGGAGHCPPCLYGWVAPWTLYSLFIWMGGPLDIVLPVYMDGWPPGHCPPCLYGWVAPWTLSTLSTRLLHPC